MINRQSFFHSPFSPSTVAKDEGPALLLQFILRELIRSDGQLSATPAPQSAPFDWAWKHGAAYKVREHALLLSYAFPELAAEAEIFTNHLHDTCHKLFSLLEPFISACQQNEKLLYFLLKHQKVAHIKSILDKICPEGLEKLKIDIILHYQKRGFYPSKWIH
jgi:hypothetical protein